ncbi:retrotransposon protein, putative, ty3-gypsy subclass [Tanacetum coccineum]
MLGVQFYSPECIAIGCTGSVCQEEGRWHFWVHIDIHAEGITMDPGKVITAYSVEGFSRLALPLTKLMRKGEKFVWNEEREKSFEELKQRLVSSPILTLPSGTGGFQIYSDASKKGLGCVLIAWEIGIRSGFWASLRVEPNLISQIKTAQKDDGEIWQIFIDNDQQTVSFRVDDDAFYGRVRRRCTTILSNTFGGVRIPVWKLGLNIHDFVTELPRNQRKPRAIWVVVDRLTKSAHSSIPIVSDKRPRFTSHSGKVYRKLWGTSAQVSTAFHPDTSTDSRSVGERIHEFPRSIEGDKKKKKKKKTKIEKVAVAREKLKEAQTRQKSYADRHRRALEFQPGEHVFLKVSPTRGVRRFGIKGKLSPRFIGPFEILDRVGEVSYRLALPPQLISVPQCVFMVSLLSMLQVSSSSRYLFNPFDHNP